MFGPCLLEFSTGRSGFLLQSKNMQSGLLVSLNALKVIMCVYLAIGCFCVPGILFFASPVIRKVSEESKI